MKRRRDPFIIFILAALPTLLGLCLWGLFSLKNIRLIGMAYAPLIIYLVGNPQPKQELSKPTDQLPDQPHSWLEQAPDLMAQLDAMTGDKSASQRLLENIRGNYADRSLDWCISKAIADLERDRR